MVESRGGDQQIKVWNELPLTTETRAQACKSLHDRIGKT